MEKVEQCEFFVMERSQQFPANRRKCNRLPFLCPPRYNGDSDVDQA